MGLLPCPVSPLSFKLLPLALPPGRRFHRHLPSQSPHPAGRKPNRAPTPPLPPAVPLLIGGLIHRSAQTASLLASESAPSTTSQGALWVKDKMLWGGTVVLLLPPRDLWPPRGGPWPSAPQRAPPLRVAPHLWWAALQGRTGRKGTAVGVSLYRGVTKVGTARARRWRSCWKSVGQHWVSLPVRTGPKTLQVGNKTIYLIS